MEKLSIYDKMYVESINLDLKSKNKNALLREMFKSMENSPFIKDKEKVFEDLLNRELIGSTGIGNGIAIPHAKTDYVDDIVISIGILKESIEYESIDEEKVNIVFMFLAPTSLSKEYLTILARISRFSQEEKFRKALLSAKTKEEILEYIKQLEK